MKKLLGILLLTLLSFTLQAQIVLIKGNMYCAQIGANYVYSEWSDWTQTATPLHIFCDMGESTMKIDNKAKDLFQIGLSYEKGTAEDDTGTYGYTRYIATDNKGITCYITIRAWKEGNLTQIYIKYADLHYVYQGSVITIPVDTVGPKTEI